MESDSALHADVPDGAEVLPLEENQAEDAVDASDSNVTSNEEAGAADDSGNLELHGVCLDTFQFNSC